MGHKVLLCLHWLNLHLSPSKDQRSLQVPTDYRRLSDLTLIIFHTLAKAFSIFSIDSCTKLHYQQFLKQDCGRVSTDELFVPSNILYLAFNVTINTIGVAFPGVTSLPQAI